MHYVIGLEPVALEQMKDLYYVPGLLQKIFKGEPLPKVELWQEGSVPYRRVFAAKARANWVCGKLTNRGGGIGQVQVLVNGKEVIKDARPARLRGDCENAGDVDTESKGRAADPGWREQYRGDCPKCFRVADEPRHTRGKGCYKVRIENRGDIEYLRNCWRHFGLYR